MNRAGRTGLMAIAAFILVVASAYACRIIDPRPWPPPRPIIMPPPAPPPLKPITTKFHSADIAVKDQVAEVKVNATFYNPNPFQVEGTYWFPLPADAAVKEFQMEINGKPVKGELLDAKRAKQIYEDIVRRRKDPALLEWMGTQMLQCRIFPMEANQDTKVALSYTQMLKEDSGLVRVNYPLRSAKPNEGTIDQLVVKVSIDSSIPLKTIYSPTQQFDINRKSDKEAVLTLEAKNVDPANDVEVIFSRDAADVGLSVVSCKPANEDGYFLLTVTPRVQVESDKVMKKDIVFVFDTSGSMGTDGKIDQAKKALKFCVASLNPGDRFGILAFSGDVRYFKKGLIERSAESVKEAEEYIDKLDAIGGTAINEALLAALDVAKDAKNVPMIIFLTDGNPTIGEQNVEKILQNAKDANRSKCRLFVFGVGYDVNTKLLDLLAEGNRGVREYVKPREDIEVKVSGLYTKVANPVLSDIQLDFGGADVDQTYPKILPDLFRGSQLTMLGRFRKPGEYTVKLTGKVGDESKTFTYTATFKDTKSDDYLPRMWAVRKVAYLLDEIRLHGENKELVDEVTRLGKLHGILTPYTSFLVVEEGAPMTTAMRREMEDAARDSRETFAEKKEGRGAVHDSSVIARAKNADLGGAPMSAAEAGQAAGQPGAPSVFGIHGGKGRGDRAAEEFDRKLTEVARQTIRQVGGKTFYVKADGFWTDAAVDSKDKVKDVKLWSDEFFALVQKYPELGKAIAENQKLVIVLGGETYRIE